MEAYILSFVDTFPVRHRIKEATSYGSWIIWIPAYVQIHWSEWMEWNCHRIRSDPHRTMDRLSSCLLGVQIDQLCWAYVRSHQQATGYLSCSKNPHTESMKLGQKWHLSSWSQPGQHFFGESLSLQKKASQFFFNFVFGCRFSYIIHQNKFEGLTLGRSQDLTIWSWWGYNGGTGKERVTDGNLQEAIL